MAGNSGSLRRYLLVRLALVIPMVWILLTFVFLLMRVAPGDPIQAALGTKVSPAQIAAKRAAAGYDKPLIQQYFEYLGQVFRGDFGTTITDNRPVLNVIGQTGAATLELSFFALIVALVVGLVGGMLAGRFRDTWFDVGSRLFAIFVYAAPVFLLGLMGQLVFSVWLGWLPSNNQAGAITQAFLTTHTHILVIDAIIDGNWTALGDVLKHLILPAVTLGLLLSGVFLRLVRVNVIQTLRNDYIEAARARGIGEGRVVLRHAFRNALVPVITIVGLQAALLLSGAVLTEETFNWPGIGKTLIDYLNQRDYVAVQGIVTMFALAVVVISLIIDFLNAWADPRMRY